MVTTVGDSAEQAVSRTDDIAYLRRKFYEDGGDEMMTNTRRGAWIAVAMSLS